MRVILASASPSRKELLKLVIPKFEVRISKVDEVMQEGLTPEEQVERLAYIKAKSVYDETKGNRIVIGADTMVVKQGKIYGKPKNREHAKEMIKELLEGDKTHEIVTGLSVIIENDEQSKEYRLQDKVKVYLKDMSEDEINKWLETGKAMDKAGAYAIQDEFCVFIEKIEGNYTTAVGLPIHKLYDIISMSCGKQ